MGSRSSVADSDRSLESCRAASSAETWCNLRVCGLSRISWRITDMTAADKMPALVRVYIAAGIHGESGSSLVKVPQGEEDVRNFVPVRHSLSAHRPALPSLMTTMDDFVNKKSPPSASLVSTDSATATDVVFPNQHQVPQENTDEVLSRSLWQDSPLTTLLDHHIRCSPKRRCAAHKRAHNLRKSKSD